MNVFLDCLYILEDINILIALKDKIVIIVLKSFKEIINWGKIGFLGQQQPTAIVQNFFFNVQLSSNVKSVFCSIYLLKVLCNLSKILVV